MALKKNPLDVYDNLGLFQRFGLPYRELTGGIDEFTGSLLVLVDGAVVA